MDYDYHNRIHPHRGQLDVECEDQADLYMHYAEKKVEADRHVSECDRKVQIQRSKIYIDCKEDTSTKHTEKSIEATIQLDKKFQRLNGELCDAKIEAKKWDLACTAFAQRKSMLEQLVKLHGNSYFSTPNTRTGEIDDFQQDIKDAEEGREDVIKKPLRRKKKRKKKSQVEED